MDRFVIGLILVIGGITGIVLYEIYLSSSFSVTPENPHVLERTMAGLVSNEISYCSYKLKINSSYATCVLTSIEKGFSNLPDPIFVYYRGLSYQNYGPGPGYYLVSPTNVLSQEQIKKLIEVIKNDPEISSEYFAWKILVIQSHPINNSWHEDVDLIIHGIRSSPNSDCGWRSDVWIDLYDLTIVKKDNTKITSYQKC